jgi:hypothetical protein
MNCQIHDLEVLTDDDVELALSLGNVVVIVLLHVEPQHRFAQQKPPLLLLLMAGQFHLLLSDFHQATRDAQ